MAAQNLSKSAGGGPAEPLAVPAASPFALRAAGLGTILLVIGLVFARGESSWRWVVYLLPTAAMIVMGLAWMRNVQAALPRLPSLDRLLRGWAGICLLSGFMAGIVVVVWHRWVHPEMLSAWLANLEASLIEQGYSPGDTDEALRRTRVTLTGPLGVFLGAVMWTLSGLLPGLVLTVLQSREQSPQNR